MLSFGRELGDWSMAALEAFRAGKHYIDSTPVPSLVKSASALNSFANLKISHIAKSL